MNVHVAPITLALTSRQIGNLIFLGVIVLFFGLIFVLLPIAIFLAAMFEKRRVGALKPAAAESMQKVLGDLTGWLITTDIAGAADLSGLEEQEMLSKASFAGMLLHHRQHIAAYGQPPIPFVAETLVQDLHHHELLRFGLMQAAGLVKPIAGREDTWVYSARGAAKLCAHFIQSAMSSKRRLELGKAKTSEAAILEASIARPLPPVA